MKRQWKLSQRKTHFHFITGTICAHNCMSKCTRNFYEDPAHIRNMKLLAAENGYEAWLKKQGVPAVTKEGKGAAVVGVVDRLVWQQHTS